MNACIITGATSMLGLATLKECIRNHVQVVALFRPGSRRRTCLPKSEWITFVECGLNELNEVLLPEYDYDVFYHFGWGYTERSTRNNPILQYENIGYTLEAVKLAYRCGCKKFLGAGSQAEYGFKNEIIKEDVPINPKSCYGIAKYAAGKLADKLCAQYKILCIWTRIFSVYGIHDGVNTMISYALNQYKMGKTAYFSEGTQMWDYLYEDDAGRYFYLLGEKMTESGVVHIASGDHKPLKEYIIEMSNVLNAAGNNGMFRFELVSSMNISARGIQPDTEKLRTLTGYVPEVSFRRGIYRVMDSMQITRGEKSNE